ncbi:HopJ type III effector protein [Aestuariibaculum sediminum]|uniref:HopJ type III effector protein n=1 Tax=Aestuariibaculum sediminum TaxID=2770637 RepID=A0A8J6U722_9FLAO|nr:HopJ type III effector protein [Aestuariibaculum sediminum]MBD0831343.1 HopJ type III effector protein [Aestuariibaculum sediminum]
MTIEIFKEKLQKTPESVEFNDTMAVVEANYEFTPTAFKNGEIQNEAGQNSGSCKLFAFAKHQNFTKEETLACFGKFYTQEVLNDPNGAGHQNIRNFMKTGFEGLTFDGQPLVSK